MKIILTFDDSTVPGYIDLLLRRYGHERIKNETDEIVFKNLCHEAVHSEIMRQMKIEQASFKWEGLEDEE